MGLEFGGEDPVALKTMAEARPVAKSEGLELGIARNGSGGLGSLIDSAESIGLIDGVRIAPLTIRPDDRGYFLEVFRGGQALMQDFGSFQTLQVSTALSYPRTIKAIHYHIRQTDLWTPVMGLFQVMLYDLRIASPTFGRINTIYAGALRPLQIRIPPGVGHGYKVVGTGPAMLVYATDRFYDPKDEGRLPWNDPDINYDWKTQRK
jgi:dTDP-4-dehydrorhamnose 3,5-epimerase